MVFTIEIKRLHLQTLHYFLAFNRQTNMAMEHPRLQ